MHIENSVLSINQPSYFPREKRPDYDSIALRMFYPTTRIVGKKKKKFSIAPKMISFLAYLDLFSNDNRVDLKFSMVF